MGTHCFFTENKRPGAVEDACFQELPHKMYDYFAKTNKVLKMKRIFVEEKETDPINSQLAEGEIENLEHLKISKTYGDALNQFLKPGEKPPRDILDSQDSQEEHGEEEMELEGDQISENVQTDVPSEESENTKAINTANIVNDTVDELKTLIDPDYEPT